eukprot:Rmarinus@m.22979
MEPWRVVVLLFCLVGACQGSTISVVLDTDSYYSEVAWYILSNSGAVLYQGSVPSSSPQTFYFDLDIGSYSVYVTDSYGDGGCAGTVTDVDSGQLLASWGQYGYSTSLTIPFEVQGPQSCPNDYVCIENQGECVDGACSCLYDFSGTYCEEGTGVCDLHWDCANGATCVNETCQCTPGFSGTSCSEGNGICPENFDCVEGHGDCVDGVCECYQGFFGEFCEDGDGSCPNNFDCLYGECVDGVCECVQGISGLTCEEGTGYCEDSPDPLFYSCQNGGTCVDGVCECTTGLYGYDCTEGDGACPAQFNCTANGYCIEEEGVCECTGNSAGLTCETGLGTCTYGAFDCVHGACGETGLCSCDDGWGGLTCERALAPDEYFMLVTYGTDIAGDCSEGSWTCDLGTAISWALQVPEKIVTIEVTQDVVRGEISIAQEKEIRLIGRHADRDGGMIYYGLTKRLVSAVGSTSRFSAENMYFYGSYSSSRSEVDGGLIFASNGAEVNVTSCIMAYINAEDGNGGLVYANSATVYILYSYIIGVTANYREASSSCFLWFCDTIEGRGGYGGLIYATTQSVVYLYSSQIQDTDAHFLGDVVYSVLDSTVVFNKLTMFTFFNTDHPGDTSGNLFYNEGGTLGIYDVFFYYVADSNIIDSSGYLEVADSNFWGAYVNDAPVLLTGGTGIFYNTNFTGNVGDDWGAGILCDGGARLYVQKCGFTSNLSFAGAALHLLACEADIYESLFAHNVAYSYGTVFVPFQSDWGSYASSGLYLDGKTRIERCIFANNTAERGTIVTDRDMTISLSIFLNNYSWEGDSNVTARGYDINMETDGTPPVVTLVNLGLLNSTTGVGAVEGVTDAPDYRIYPSEYVAGCDSGVCEGVAQCRERVADVVCYCSDHYLLTTSGQSCTYGFPPPQELDTSAVGLDYIDLEWLDVHDGRVEVQGYLVQVYRGDQAATAGLEDVEGMQYSLLETRELTVADVTKEVGGVRSYRVDNLDQGAVYMFQVATDYTMSFIAGFNYTDFSSNVTRQVLYSYAEVLPPQQAVLVEKPHAVDVIIYLFNSGTGIMEWSVLVDEMSSNVVLDQLEGSATVGDYSIVIATYDSAGQDPTSGEPLQLEIPFWTNSEFTSKIIAYVSVSVLSKAFAAECTVISPAGFQEAVAGQIPETIVIAGDVDGLKLYDGSASFMLSVEDEDLNLEYSDIMIYVPLNATYGEYQLSPLVHTAGNWLVHVSLESYLEGSQEINGSPYVLTVIPDQTTQVKWTLAEADVTAGHSMRMELVARDAYSNLQVYEDPFSVEVIMDGLTALLQRVSFNGAGKHTYEHPVYRVTEYTIRVELGQIDFGGPEFVVSPAEPDPSHSDIEGCSLNTLCRSGTAGVPMEFGVILRDMYDNECKFRLYADSMFAFLVLENDELLELEISTVGVLLNSWIAGSAGLHVMLNNLELRTSPTNIEVRPDQSSHITTSIVPCDPREDADDSDCGRVDRSTVEEGGLFYVLVRDRYGNRQSSTTADTMDVELVNKENPSAPTIIGQIEQIGTDYPDVYRVLYQTATNNAGWFDVYIRLNDRLIADSPFEMFSACPPGTYHHEGKCVECRDEDNELIEGLSCAEAGIFLPTAGVEPNYWRSGPETTVVHKCFFTKSYPGSKTNCREAEEGDPDAEEEVSCNVCIGISQWDYERGADGQCREGYIDRLCSVCDDGYTRRGATFQCERCPEVGVNLAILFFVACILAFGMSYVINVQLRWYDRIQKLGRRKDREDYVVVMKIAMSYVQVLRFAGNIDFDWPGAVDNMFSLMTTVSSASQGWLSVDCFLGGGSRNAFFTKVRLVLLLPPILMIFVLVFYNMFYLYIQRMREERKKSKIEAYKPTVAALGSNPEDTDTPSRGRRERRESVTILQMRSSMMEKIQNHVAVTMIVVLFVLYPTITETVLMLLNCYELEDKWYLVESMDMECYGSRHQTVLITNFLPGLAIYTVGIPLYGFLVLYWNRHRLDSNRILARYGFLYNGFEPKFYWWEIWIMVRKTGVVFITVFMTGFGITVQGLVLIGLLILSILLHVYAQPYVKNKMDNLESLTLVTSFLTIYAGLFFYEQDIHERPWLRGILTLFVVMMNVVTILALFSSFVHSFVTSEQNKRRMSKLTHSLKRDHNRNLGSLVSAETQAKYAADISVEARAAAKAKALEMDVPPVTPLHLMPTVAALPTTDNAVPTTVAGTGPREDDSDDTSVTSSSVLSSSSEEGNSGKISTDDEEATTLPGMRRSLPDTEAPASTPRDLSVRGKNPLRSL